MISSDAILEFKMYNALGGIYIWKKSKAKLHKARGNHLAFHVPEELVTI